MFIKRTQRNFASNPVRVRILSRKIWLAHLGATHWSIFRLLMSNNGFHSNYTYCIRSFILEPVLHTGLQTLIPLWNITQAIKRRHVSPLNFPSTWKVQNYFRYSVYYRKYTFPPANRKWPWISLVCIGWAPNCLLLLSDFRFFKIHKNGSAFNPWKTIKSGRSK